MAELLRRVSINQSGEPSVDALLSKEWLVTNGLGGYACGTLCGVITRRYHGFLIAALPAPLGRVVMLNGLREELRFPEGGTAALDGEERAGKPPLMHGAGYLTEFVLDDGCPIWRYAVKGRVITKRIWMPHRQNTVHITYGLETSDAGAPVELVLRPIVHFRAHEAPVSSDLGGPYAITILGQRFEISAGPNLPTLRMQLCGEGGMFTVETREDSDIFYRIEQSRGYEHQGELWSPGYFHLWLKPGQEATLVASTESWEVVGAIGPTALPPLELERRESLLMTAAPKASDSFGQELVLASDAFIITPAGRIEDATRAHAAGDEVRTVIAGYHWFTDWGRDTMISLEGLALVTGRRDEAGWILRTFAHYIKDGLIPNMFPEREKEGLYNTVDATLWFFHAIDRYMEATGDRATLRILLPKLVDIMQHHLEGTRFGIKVDPADGLLQHGAPNVQLTWMDAKVGDWVVTPRDGKAVEVNALWYNALCLLARFCDEEGHPAAAEAARHAARARESFNKRFWNEERGYLYDVVDGPNGNDPACRPNQVFAISLPNPVLDEARWEPVMKVVTERLLTPVGLRSLAPGHPDYKAQYYGDLRSRDAAYHQGTVWAWLIGPYIDAWLKLNPEDRAGARKLLEGFKAHLSEACIGQISEIFDAEAPFTPRGCVAQAWSVAEVLRTWVKTSK